MGAKTGIAWTDSSWNALRGCSAVNEGCRNCYAMGVAARFSGEGQPYVGLAKYSDSGRAQWTGEVRLIPEMLDLPIRWKKPRRIFVNSMSDLFHETVANEVIAAILAVMAAAPQHTFQVLTKRPKRMLEWFRWVDTRPQDPGTGGGMVHPFGVLCRAAQYQELDITAERLYRQRGGGPAPWPLPNVQLGVSVHDQTSADAFVPLLLQVPAAVRFVSYEPAVARVDFSMWLPAGYVASEGGQYATDALDWIIVGGESGPRARPFEIEWARYVVEQGRRSGCPVFVKQLGGNVYGDLYGEEPFDPGKRHSFVSRAASDPEEWPADLRVQEWPGAGLP